jgi:drug/metabolite transporter (DMT)-like permease
MCLAASIAYAVNGVVVETVRKKHPDMFSIIQLLSIEGFVAAIALLSYVVGTVLFTPEAFVSWHAAFPQAKWVVLLMSSGILLNIGWLWCAEIAGASWAAMAACLSIPISLVLDYLLLNVSPGLIEFAGAALVVLGLVVASLMVESTDSDSEPSCKKRWRGLFQSSAAPLLLAVESIEEGTAVEVGGDSSGSASASACAENCAPIVSARPA